MRLFIWAITAPLWVPLWLLWEFFFGSSPTVYEYDTDHEYNTGDDDND